DSDQDVASGEVYLGMMKQNGVMYGLSKHRFADVRDGTSNTALVGETYTDYSNSRDGEALDHWYIGMPQTGYWNATASGETEGTEFSEAAGSMWPKINAALDPAISGDMADLAFGSYHPGGAMFVFCDGSVRFLPETIDIETYRGMGSRNGREALQSF